ncbi:glucose dehydrogenase [FAD, quinone] [Agrilus planipennis]|uniref:Glucose dehydrogenase [FAD, quinone] n=1 Tax=Agrilus planipennis TaxID=224129 RepID=A0A1W4XE63_AGRPL|nr:glucose dehydrogenase [FAD, quinone] [Agrilus planipennis]
MKTFPTTLVGFLLAISTVHASPFELTDNYVAEFEKGMEELKHIAQEHHFHHEDIHYDPDHHNVSEALTEAENYDFIVIGSGSAGGVVAARLSEIPEWKILLLEAGAPETPYTQIPGMAYHLQNTPYNWGYTTTPQESFCLGMEENKCACATGKALGGSTAINSMMYTRGNKRDYDLWADNGNLGWCYDDVLPYFKKMENIDLPHFDRKYHHQGGPVHVEVPQHLSEYAEDFLEAGKELGIKTVDYNGADQMGFGITQVTTKHGKRNSVAQAYLQPAKKRHNLNIKPLSQVVEILINPHTKEASGVKYIHDGKLYVAKAEKEVILSAGAYNSPQLLMLSGIGPKEDLEHLEIPVVADLPVGKHLKDHISFIGMDFILNKEKDKPTDPHEDLVQWLKEGKGPLASIRAEGLGYIRTEVSKDPEDYPDIEIIFSPKSRKIGEEKARNIRVKKEIYDGLWRPLEDKETFSIEVMLTHPKSTGTLKLKSKNPFHPPLLDARQLTDPDNHDLETMLAGVKKALEIPKTHAFQKYGAHLNEHPIPGCEALEFGSENYWKCAIRHLSVSLRHTTGTCRMGPKHDKDAVVDNKLKVHGIHKLRVADASVIPVSISGHTNAAAIMIGEKAADIIKHDWL